MKKVKTTTYSLPTDGKPCQEQEPLYKSGDIYKKNFHPNGTERNKQAHRQTISQISELLGKDKPTPSKAISTPHAKGATSHPPHDTETEDHFNTPPRVPDNAFPPDLQSAVDTACHGTEAHPMAVALHYAVYFAAHIGQQRYIRIGNEKHSLDLYGLLVGKTGKVKGTAESQARCIEQLATAELTENYGYKPPRKLSGLSSGEGLIQVIKDPDDDDEEDKPPVDKRLLITESGYANVLTQDQRGGNTLSVVLRDAYDGKTLSNLTVTSRVATSPHISIIGHITPGELLGHKSFLSQSVNGALNRNLIFFARREKTTPTPRQYTPEEAEALSQWLAEAIYRARNQQCSDNYQAKHQGSEMMMSEPAKAVINREYHRREAEQDAMPELLANLVSRHRVFVWRLSAILALMDGTDTVAAEHVQQAYCWLDYSLASIRYL